MRRPTRGFPLWAAAGIRTRIAAAVIAGAAAAATAFVWWGDRGEAPPAGVQGQFRDGARAYGEGRFAEAARLYEDVAQRGQAVPEVLYNLGNAHLKAGRVGEAVLNYRRAWVCAPRDADVRANLGLALQVTGAAEPDLSSVELAFTWLSRREWGAVALLAWWSLWLALALAAASRRWRRIALRLAVVAAAATIAAVGGLGVWRGFERAPEFVVLHEPKNALAAPAASASPRFPLPEGSVVRARRVQGEWVSVSHGQLGGWLQRAAGAPVLPGMATE